MSEPEVMDKTFHFILKRMMETGVAPHYTEIFGMRIPAWLFPGTDYIVSFAPFNNLPTQYRLTIDGQQKWFGQ
ncbi:MAG: hypothetical protein AMJ94_10280 [Deltaproteobacteria bacterium SM23_61]|nr:MAG: hypothetical protein AMJ94_10280 [Deltaproteobacteria bacterium SM23_61]